MSTSHLLTTDRPAARALPPIEPAPPGDQLRARDVVSAFWAAKGLVLSTMLLCALAAVAAAWVMPRTYEATVVLLPASDASAGGMSGAGAALAQLSGLSLLGGFSLPSDSKRVQAIALLQSDALTQRYIREHELLPILYSELWDPSTRGWKVRDPDKVPTLWKANERFKRGIRTVKVDPKTGLVTLTIAWKDPRIAATWANDLVRLTNDHLRSKVLAQTEHNIAYLNKAADATVALEGRQVIYALLQNQVNEAMLARGTEEYAFDVLDPASVPEKPASPKKLLYLLIGLGAGLLLSVLMVSYRARWI